MNHEFDMFKYLELYLQNNSSFEEKSNIDISEFEQL